MGICPLQENGTGSIRTSSSLSSPPAEEIKERPTVDTSAGKTGKKITRIFNESKWPPILGDEDSINRLKTRFYEQKIHPEVSDSRSLAPGCPPDIAGCMSNRSPPPR